MAALTIRNLPDDVHARLRAGASASQLSVEGFVRRILAEAPIAGSAVENATTLGFSEAAMPYTHVPGAAPAAPIPELWGALKGSVQVAPGADLTAPLDEGWSTLA